MTLAGTAPWDVWGSLAPLWHRAGANVFDTVESILEMLIALQAQGPLRDHHEELTAKGWRSVRRQLFSQDQVIAEAEGHRTERYFLTPGLLEQTRRILEPFSIAPDTARALLHYFAYGVQTGLRHTELGEFKLPPFLKSLVKGLLDPRPNETVYCPFESSGWLPLMLAADGWTVYSEVQNQQAARVLALFSRLGRWNLDVHLSDPIRSPSWLEGPNLRVFDHSAAVATFGFREREDLTGDQFKRFPMRCHYGEANQLAHLLAQSKRRVVLVVPEGFLFRTAGGERTYKEYLLRQGWLAAVVSLPRGAFAQTSIRTSLLILDKRQSAHRDILFIDGTSNLASDASAMATRGNDRIGTEPLLALINDRQKGPHSAPVRMQEIANNDFNLSVDRYVRTSWQDFVDDFLDRVGTVELGDIAEIIRPQVIATDPAEPTATFAEVAVSDITADGSVSQPSKLVQVSTKGMAQAMRQRLETGDLLLSVKGRIGAVGIVMELAPDWVPSQAFVIIRLRRTSPIKSPLILFRYLASPFMQGLLKSLSSGTVPSLQMGDVRKLRVIVPTIEEEQMIESQHDQIQKLRKQITELEKHAGELNKVAWPMTTIAIHNADEKVD